MDNYIKKRNSDSVVSFVNEQENSRAVSAYIKKRGKRRPQLAEEIRRSQSTGPGTMQRSDTTMTTRSLPTPATLRTVEEVTYAVEKNSVGSL